MELNRENPKKITFIFNMALLSYICCAVLAEYLFKPETPDNVPWESLFKNSPALSIMLALIFAVILILAGSNLLKIFWNHFVSDIMKLREVTFHEAMAIFLILVAVFS